MSALWFLIGFATGAIVAVAGLTAMVTRLTSTTRTDKEYLRGEK